MPERPLHDSVSPTHTLRPSTVAADERAYEPGGAPSRLTAEAPTLRDSEAEYELEYPATCPACKETVETLKVVRLVRTRVNFTSTLPRRGRLVMCPHCRAIISAALTIV